MNDTFGKKLKPGNQAIWIKSANSNGADIEKVVIVRKCDECKEKTILIKYIQMLGYWKHKIFNYEGFNVVYNKVQPSNLIKL